MGGGVRGEAFGGGIGGPLQSHQAATKPGSEGVRALVRRSRWPLRVSLLERITHDPTVMGGRPCIRGMRVTVGTIVGLLASGHSIDDVLSHYPYLERDDVLAALSFAAWRAEEVDVPLQAS